MFLSLKIGGESVGLILVDDLEERTKMLCYLNASKVRVMAWHRQSIA